MDYSVFGLPMWQTLQRYNALSSEARVMFWRAACLLPFVRVKLRFGGYKKTQQWLQKKLGDRLQLSSTAQDTSPVLQMTCRMVRAAEHYSPGQATCLEESLLLWYLLQSQSIPAVVCIGVRKQSERFEAHAWVEQNGIALNQQDHEHRHYAAFESEQLNPPSELP